LRITVNGRVLEPAAEPAAEPARTLLDWLRDELGLTAAKRGCAEGHCGSCTVLVNGRPVLSCRQPLAGLDGAEVLTLEGLAAPSRLHPLQQAFIEEGAVQCGFCTPGMILAAKALLDREPEPTDRQIARALAANLCRCTGYVKILKAVHRAAEWLRQGLDSFPRAGLLPDEPAPFGRPVPRVDALGKATGELKFAEDLRFPGLLHAAVLRSEHPHARIVELDPAAARARPGVVAVLTARDLPGRNAFGLLVADQPVFAAHKVRCLGDALAAVVAESEEAAREALGHIRVRYKPLPVLSSPEQALASGAPLVHERTAEGDSPARMPGVGSEGGGEGAGAGAEELPANVVARKRSGRGEVERGLAEAEEVLEDEYFTPFIEHAYLEPECGIGVLEPDGRVTVHVGSQGPWEDRRQVAAALGMSEERVRIAHLPLGGGFGGKEDVTVQIIAALAALKTGRPVRLRFDRRESIRASVKRHAASLRYTTGVKKDGQITAVKARILADSGAYASVGEVVIQRAVSFGAGPYAVPHADIEALCVYTNNLPGGAMRGFGNPQATFAAEVQLNRLAERLGLDPFEIRLRNILEEGRPTVTGERIRSSVGARACLEAVREALRRAPPLAPRAGWKIGTGLACSYKNVGLGTGLDDYAGASGEILPAGLLRVRVGSADMGQGSDTVMAQIACQELGWPYSRVVVESGDTDRDPASLITTASRQTFVSGNAVLAMARELKARLREWLAGRFGVPAPGIELRDGFCLESATGRKLAALEKLSELAAADGVALAARVRYSAPRTWPDLREPKGGFPDGERRLHAAYCFGAQAVSLEVDPASGRVNVLRVIAASDAGRAVNPAAVEGQMEGGVVMGLGYALSEEFRLEQGRILTDTLARLGLWRATQVPPIQCIIVENPHEEGPYGAKGMSELPVSMAAPAVVSALHDALGVWLTRIPATPERILAALGKGGSA
jgi:CO/xanthine dehydrogenase Mo-binding subunit/aerobic-type carbon monoxide dehydrogenase small subunit (CoxS/CutS family)